MKELSPQVLAALKEANLTVEDAQKRTVEELVKIKGIGEASAKQILELKTEGEDVHAKGDGTIDEDKVDKVKEQEAEMKKASSLEKAAAKLSDAKTAEESFKEGNYEFGFRFIERGIVIEEHNICGTGKDESAAMSDARMKAEVYNAGRYIVAYTGNFKKLK